MVNKKFIIGQRNSLQLNCPLSLTTYTKELQERLVNCKEIIYLVKKIDNIGVEKIKAEETVLVSIVNNDLNKAEQSNNKRLTDGKKEQKDKKKNYTTPTLIVLLLLVFSFFIYNSTEFVSNDNEDEPTLYTQTPTVETQDPAPKPQYPTTVETQDPAPKPQTPKVNKNVKENTNIVSTPLNKTVITPKSPKKTVGYNPDCNLCKKLRFKITIAKGSESYEKTLKQFNSHLQSHTN
jgi:hypothetical protein